MKATKELETDSIMVSRIKHAMRLLNYNSVKLSEISGVNQTTISLLLNGKRLHSRSDTIGRIAQALQVNMQYLLGTTDDPSMSPVNKYPKYGMEVLSYMNRMSIDRQMLLMKMAKMFADEEGPAMQAPEEE